MQMANSNEMILNWKNSLMQDRRGDVEHVAEMFDKKLAEGISIDSAVEIVVGCGYPLDLVKEIAATRRSEINASLNQPTSAPEIPVAPTSYADVKANVEHIVTSMNSEDTMPIFAGKTRNTPSLVRLTSKERPKFEATLTRARRARDEMSISEVHKWMAPHIETAIHDSEILARDLSDNDATVITARDDMNTYDVREASGKSCKVDLSAMTCTCPRYVFGSFAHIGIACEHILYAMSESENATQDNMNRST